MHALTIALCLLATPALADVAGVATVAVRAYTENPSELNSTRVRNALLRLRTARERALAERISQALDARERQDRGRTSRFRETGSSS